jgi:hypothetical protein
MPSFAEKANDPWALAILQRRASEDYLEAHPPKSLASAVMQSSTRFADCEQAHRRNDRTHVASISSDAKFTVRFRFIK